MRLFLAILTLVFALGLGVDAQAQPVNNPYRAWSPHVAATQVHWSDSLPWQRVYNIHQFSNVVRFDTLTDSVLRADWLPAYNAAKAAAKAAGGGVIYFPRLPQRSNALMAGEDSAYYFSNTISIPTNVVIRGDDPHPDSGNALTARFKPPTYFEFPFYDFLSGVGVAPPPGSARGGTPDSTAFKMILLEPGSTGNCGIVNVDINRGKVLLLPRFQTVTVPDPLQPGGTKTTKHSLDKVRNVLLLGLRVNNTAEPSPDVPTNIQLPHQRYPWRFHAPITITAWANASIANCRVNDADSSLLTRYYTESFDMPEYRHSTQSFATLQNVKFDYTLGYGLVLNRSKRDLTNSGQPDGYVPYAGPLQEPDLFATGLVAENNWVMHRSRVGIHAGGLGTIIRNNVIRDDKNKREWLHPTATQVNINPVATYENRGIDVSGQSILVENNNIQVYRTRLPSIGTKNWSADGEGFYCQMENGVQSSNLIFRGNVVITDTNGMRETLNSGQRKGFNGVANTRLAYDILIENNNSGGMPIWVQAQNGTDPLQVSGVTIRRNTRVRSIRVDAAYGGQRSYVYENVGTPDSVRSGSDEMRNRIITQCHVWLNGNPSAPRDVNTNVDLLARPCLPIAPAADPCSATLPSLNWLMPTADSIIIDPNQTDVVLEIDIPSFGNCNQGPVNFQQDGLVRGQFVQATNTSYTYQFVLPAGSFDSWVRAEAVFPRPGGGMPLSAYSTVRRITRAPVASTAQRLMPQPKLFPNPASHQVQIGLPENGPATVVLTDQLGKTLRQWQVSGSQALTLGQLPAGAYLMRIDQAQQRWVQRLLVQP